MRLNEILTEQQIDEAPKGFLSRAKDKILSKVPGASTGAKARLEVGKEANWLKDKFMTFIKKIQKPATPQTVIDFLRKNNYPTGDAEQEMTKVTTGQKIGGAVGKAAGNVAKGIKTAVGSVAKGAENLKKSNTDAKQPPEMAKQNSQQPNDAEANKQDPNSQNTTQTPADTQKQPEGNPDNNLAIKGEKGKKIPLPSQNKQVVNQSIDWSGAQFIFEDAQAALSGGQLDNIFMAAVKQAIARDEGGQADQGTGVAPADAQTGGIKGAAKAAADSFGKATAEVGSTLPPEIKKQLETLPMRDKQNLLKML